MHPVTDLVYGLLALAWRHRWRGLLAAWTVCVVGWVAIAQIPVNYRSSVAFEINIDSMLRGLMRGIYVEPEGPPAAVQQAKFQAIRDALLSEENIARAVELAHPNRGTDAPAPIGAGDARDRVAVTFERDSRLVLSFTDPDPVHARDFIQALGDIFVTLDVRPDAREFDETHAFLAEQARTLEDARRQAEQRLMEFEIRNRSFLPGEGGYRARLALARRSLDETQASVEQIAALRDALDRQLRGGPGDGNPRLAALRQSLEELRTRYTENHPDVIATRRLIAEESGGTAPESTPEGAATAPAAADIARLRFDLAQANANVAALQRRAAGLRAEIAELEAFVEQAPPVEAEYTRLKIELTAAQRRYDTIADRLERVRMTQELNTKTDPMRIRVVEPAQLGAAPLWLDRRLLGAAVLGFGLVGGAAISLLLGLASATVYSTSQAAEYFGRPILATVSRIRLPGAAPRRLAGTLGFTLGLVALVAAYGVALAGMAPAIWSNLAG